MKNNLRYELATNIVSIGPGVMGGRTLFVGKKPVLSAFAHYMHYDSLDEHLISEFWGINMISRN
jgi:uncharacterized protein (DUF433 family)